MTIFKHDANFSLFFILFVRDVVALGLSRLEVRADQLAKAREMCRGAKQFVLKRHFVSRIWMLVN